MVMERRRYLRHKVHSPAYASIGAGIGGIVLDANERGAALQSLTRLAPQSFVDLRLDLLDTRGSAVTPARVAWCDEEGRAGLEFLNLTGESRRQLQQWLLLNALLGTESAGKLTQAAQVPPSAPQPQQEVAGDPALLHFAGQALACTAADGAAIALAEGAAIVCRATAGEIAPPLGTKLDEASGISGACLRSGRWLRCDDPRVDPHADRESCQALGINSILAVPVGERGGVLGLMEVFSRSPYAFKEPHCAALQELAKTLASALRPEPVAAPPAAAASPAPEIKEPAVAEEKGGEPAAGLTNPQPPPSATPAAPINIPPVAALDSASSSPEKRLASGSGERLALLGLVAALALLGLWFALGRGPGAAKDVSAAEMPATTKPSTPAIPAQRNSEVTAELSPPVPADSLRQLRRRAEGDDAEAQFELGAKYASGEDVAQDYSEAVKWFTRAANGGQVLAAATLGAYYWAGRGVPKDDVSAYMWSAIARQGGDEASKYRLSILRARMSLGEIAEAEGRAAAWQRAHARRRLVQGATQ